VSTAPASGAGAAPDPIVAWENEGGNLAAPPSPRAPRHIVRSGKRAEDTALGCRANAAANLVRANAPGGDYMRERLEHSASVWSARADLLERLEKKFRSRIAAG
jgi:hypothetical protein